MRSTRGEKLRVAGSQADMGEEQGAWLENFVGSLDFILKNFDS